MESPQRIVRLVAQADFAEKISEGGKKKATPSRKHEHGNEQKKGKKGGAEPSSKSFGKDTEKRGKSKNHSRGVAQTVFRSSQKTNWVGF